MGGATRCLGVVGYTLGGTSKGESGTRYGGVGVLINGGVGSSLEESGNRRGVG